MITMVHLPINNRDKNVVILLICSDALSILHIPSISEMINHMKQWLCNVIRPCNALLCDQGKYQQLYGQYAMEKTISVVNGVSIIPHM
jgi:hypothetical protein